MPRYLTFLLAGFFLFASVIRSQDTDNQTPPATQGAPLSKPLMKESGLDSKIDVPAKLKRSMPPTYPMEAKQKWIDGDVKIHALVGKNGKVLKAELVLGDPLLAKAALNAVLQWEYQPALLNGEPVETTVTVTLRFKLSHPVESNSQSAS